MAAQLTTLKATQADGMYYPPHWRPEMGSLDKMHGSHHLTHQAKKIKEGILIVRIELPFPIWCTGCNNKFALATRYTAEKFCVGKYLSTPVYKFKMKCHKCPQMHEMRTDPANFDYLCVSGCRRDVRTWDMEENGQVSFTDSAERARLDTDPMFALEKGKNDKNVHDERKPELLKLKIENAVKHGDSFKLNRALRAGLRYAKWHENESTDDEKALAKVIMTQKVKSAGSSKTQGTQNKLKGAKRTLTLSKLGVSKKSKSADGFVKPTTPPKPSPAKMGLICDYSDSSEDES